MQYPELPGLTWDGQIYHDRAMGTLEALIPPGAYRSAHAPALVELPNGDLLCAWFAGTYEGQADIRIVCARLPQGSSRWEAPAPISGDPERSEQNPSFFAAPSGELWCVYTAQKDRDPTKDNMQFTAQIRRQISRDGGVSWEAYETLFPREGSFCRQPIQILSNGRWIVGHWLCSDADDALAGDPSVFMLSDDEGETWREVPIPHSRGRVHPNVIEMEKGHLVCFLRSRAADFIYRCESFDFGGSWSEPVPTVLPNNNSSISALRLADGRIAIAYNPTSAPAHHAGTAAWPGLRCPVAVAITEDAGLTFPLIRWMERGEGYIGEENRSNNQQYEYPYLLQSQDGMLHLVYAAHNRQGIKYLSFPVEAVEGAVRTRSSHYNPTSSQG